MPGRVEESCLSLPGIFETVERATRIRVRAFDRDGIASERELEGLAAVCLQHEMDHLAGKLFIDRLSFVQRWRTKRRIAGERKPGYEKARA
jgi:peptide deformylase